jgi:hypothetical protein
MRALACSLTLLVSTVGSAAAGAQVSKPKPLWQIDLKKYGAHGPRLGFINDPGSNVVIACTKQVVAIAFLSEVKEHKDSSTGKPGSPYKLIGLFFDASTGKLLAHQAWDVNQFLDYNIFATRGGNFLLFLKRTSFSGDSAHKTSNILVSLSPKGQSLKSVDLPISAEPTHTTPDWWDVQVAPIGDTVLLTHAKDDLREYQILDPDTLESRMAWHENASSAMWIFSISSHSVLRQNENTKEVYLGQGENMGQGPLRLPKSARMAFLNDQQIVTFDQEPKRVTIMNASGEIALDYDLKIGETGTVYAPIVAADGLYFAGSIDVGPKSIFSPSRSYVFVGKVQVRDTLLALEIPWPSPGLNSIFISPDGDLLGVVSGARFSVFSIPRETTRSD